MAKNERCVGCGIEASQHSLVGIGMADESLADFAISEPSERGFVAYGICKTCHTNPAHRRRTLKLAFFERRSLEPALALAGSNAVNAGGK